MNSVLQALFLTHSFSFTLINKFTKSEELPHSVEQNTAEKQDEEKKEEKNESCEMIDIDTQVLRNENHDSKEKSKKLTINNNERKENQNATSHKEEEKKIERKSINLNILDVRLIKSLGFQMYKLFLLMSRSIRSYVKPLGNIYSKCSSVI
jgi:hypothetical protein